MTDEFRHASSGSEALWENTGLSRKSLFKAAGITAGGLALLGPGSAGATLRRLGARSATAPFTGYTMAVSEPIVVEAISSFVVQMVATAGAHRRREGHPGELEPERHLAARAGGELH